MKLFKTLKFWPHQHVLSLFLYRADSEPYLNSIFQALIYPKAKFLWLFQLVHFHLRTISLKKKLNVEWRATGPAET